MLEIFYSDKMEAWFNTNDFSKFLLIFFSTAQSSCEKERIWRWINQLYFFFKQQLILITENKQKICGTFSLERSFANFFSKKKKANFNSHRSHVSFKGLYKAAKFYSQKPQVAVSLLKKIKYMESPLSVLHIFPLRASLLPHPTYKSLCGLHSWHIIPQ